ncbi:MAG: F-type H+-transporting ATPase subunit epsilon [Halioglobus sp.]|jgi:F-type H+-transporting ATPase subunit epsilon
MELIVLTPEKEIFQGSIESVKVPGTSGQFEILKGHAPIVSSLVTGAVRIITSTGDKETFNINKGFVEVLGEEVSLLVQGVEEIED